MADTSKPMPGLFLGVSYHELARREFIFMSIVGGLFALIGIGGTLELAGVAGPRRETTWEPYMGIAVGIIGVLGVIVSYFVMRRRASTAPPTRQLHCRQCEKEVEAVRLRPSLLLTATMAFVAGSMLGLRVRDSLVVLLVAFGLFFVLSPLLVLRYVLVKKWYCPQCSHPFFRRLFSRKLTTK